MNKEKSVKIVKGVLSALWWLVLIGLVLLIVSIIGAKLKGEVPKIFGYSVMRIISGSMEPEISIGDYILTRECDPESVKPGDIISFYSDDPTIYGMPNTHKVEAITRTENGIEFVTKGTANPIPDTVSAKADKLIGVYKGKLQFLAKLSDALDGGGMFVILILLQFATITVVVLTFIKKNADENKQGKS